MHSSVHQTETLLFTVLLQLIVMIAAARIGNRILKHLGQPGVIGEIIAGLVLGPSLLGYFLPHLSLFVFGASTPAPVTILSQIGLVLLMFQIGSDFEFCHLVKSRNRNATIGVAAASICVPLALGFGIGQLSASTLAPHMNPLVYSLFCAVGLAITAVPVLGRILREFDMTRTELGVVAISAAAANDVSGWLCLAALSAFAASAFQPGTIALQVSGIIALELGELVDVDGDAAGIRWRSRHHRATGSGHHQPVPGFISGGATHHQPAVEDLSGQEWRVAAQPHHHRDLHDLCDGHLHLLSGHLHHLRRLSLRLAVSS